MKPYRLHEADLQIPDEWEDNTINAFSLPGGKDKNAASFVVTRDGKTKSPDVRHYGDQQLVEAAKNLKGYHLIERRDVTIDGRPAIEVDYTWRTPQRVDIQQRQAFVQWEGVFLILTLTAQRSVFSQHQGVWSSIVESVRLQQSP